MKAISPARLPRVCSSALVLVCLASCSSGGSSAGAGGAPDPIAIIGKIQGCPYDSTLTLGPTDGHGDRYAECSFQDGPDATSSTTVTVYTNTTRPSLPNLVSDQNNKIIVGDKFIAEVSYAVPGNVDPSTVASEIGGSVQ
jgi:hypothetical protein